MIIGRTIEIARSPAEVYDFLVDQGSWAKLDPALTDVTPRGEVTIGMSGTMTRRVTGMKVTTYWTVTELAPGSRSTMVISGRGYELRETTSLAPAAAGTQVKIVDTLTPTSLGGRFFVAVSGRFIRRDLEARAGRLKALLEGPGRSAT